MTALITVSNSDGVVGRCDAKCYDAQSPDCDCICGGRNHGAGLEQGLANNTLDYLGPEALEAFAAKHGLDARTLQLRAQPDLFARGNAR